MRLADKTTTRARALHRPSPKYPSACGGAAGTDEHSDTGVKWLDDSPPCCFRRSIA